jgi:DNA repair exonuclease SbcCD ATPase subunit
MYSHSFLRSKKIMAIPEKRVENAVLAFIQEHYTEEDYKANRPTVVEVEAAYPAATGMTAGHGTVQKAVRTWKDSFREKQNSIFDGWKMIADTRFSEVNEGVWRLFLPTVKAIVDNEIAKKNEELAEERENSDRACDLADEAEKLRAQAQEAVVNEQRRAEELREKLEKANGEIRSLQDRLNEAIEREQSATKERNELLKALAASESHAKTLAQVLATFSNKPISAFSMQPEQENAPTEDSQSETA